jgi:TetR/AcrR family transcriptional regulator, transcriptional repressor for nem operon
MARDQRNRDKILDAAADLFHRRGFQPTSLDEILGESGVCRSNFYYHFRSKDDLGLAVLARREDRFDAEVLAVLHDETMSARERIERLFAMMEESLTPDACLNGCPFGNLAAELNGIHPEFRVRLSAFFRKWEQAIEQCLREGIARGEFGCDLNAYRVATALVSQIEGAMLLMKAHGSGDPLEAGAHVMLNLLVSR